MSQIDAFKHYSSAGTADKSSDSLTLDAAFWDDKRLIGQRE
jgi:hypothetical protein